MGSLLSQSNQLLPFRFSICVSNQQMYTLIYTLEPYVPKRILNSSMNICWYLMDLEKSLNITLNSAQVPGLNSVVARAPGSREGWIFISNWHFGVFGDLWLQVGVLDKGKRKEKLTEVQERDQKDKGEKRMRGTERQLKDKEGVDLLRKESSLLIAH